VKPRGGSEKSFKWLSFGTLLKNSELTEAAAERFAEKLVLGLSFERARLQPRR
jgi:hypothetical protein